MLKALIYLSKSNYELSKLELKKLIISSQERNSQLLISGFLTKFDKNYLQYLEGTEKRVSILMESIARDPRHNIEKVVKYNLPKRRCEQWSMVYLNSKFQTGPHFGHLMNSLLDVATLVDEKDLSKSSGELFDRLICNWEQFNQRHRSIVNKNV